MALFSYFLFLSISHSGLTENFVFICMEMRRTRICIQSFCVLLLFCCRFAGICSGIGGVAKRRISYSKVQNFMEYFHRRMKTRSVNFKPEKHSHSSSGEWTKKTRARAREEKTSTTNTNFFSFRLESCNMFMYILGIVCAHLVRSMDVANLKLPTPSKKLQ